MPNRFHALLPLLLSLSACFIQHHELIGVAEPVAPGAWSGAWVAEPLEPGDEPGFFRVTDVDPAAGIFTVEDADADGNGLGEAMQMHLRRVGQQLFLDVRDKAENPWMLFVVAQSSTGNVVLAWKPDAAAFEQRIAAGDFRARLARDSSGAVEEIAFDGLGEPAQQLLADNWTALFTPERITLKRMAGPD